MMWWAVWCAAVVSAGAGAAAAPAPDALGPLESFNVLQVDDPANNVVDTFGAVDLSEMGPEPWINYHHPDPIQTLGGERVKRRMPSLSIDMPMSVLRQKMSQAQERKVMALRAAANRNIFDEIGKRGFAWAPMSNSERYF